EHAQIEQPDRRDEQHEPREVQALGDRPRPARIHERGEPRPLEPLDHALDVVHQAAPGKSLAIRYVYVYASRRPRKIEVVHNAIETHATARVFVSGTYGSCAAGPTSTWLRNHCT